MPSPDAKKNGCPTKLVEVRSGQIVIRGRSSILKKDTIQKKSFGLLQAVADTLKAVPQIKKVRVEGHTDNVGAADFNLDLSKRRAGSVVRWLVEHGVEAGRLESEGYGMNRPVADNKTKVGQAKNRRVDFIIVDPPQAAERSARPGGSGARPAPAPAPLPARSGWQGGQGG